MLSEASQKLNLLIAVAAALLCVTPLFSHQDHSPVKDNFEVTLVVDPPLQRSSSILAPFFIVLIPVADLLLDLPLKVFTYLYPEKLSAKCHKSSVVVRLKDIEKLVFMVGMGVQSSVWFLPSSLDVTFVGLVYSVTFGASMIIVLTPILTFLQRCTTTFTAFSATVITVTSSIGVVFFAVRYFVRNDHRSFLLLTYFGWSLCGFAAAAFMFLVGLCAYKYCHHKLQTTSDREALLAWLRNPFKKTSPPVKGYTNKATDNDSELYTNYVPAMHMISMVVIIISGIYVGLLPGEHQNLAHERKNYTIIVAEIMILVIELRIRKNEIARGLIALLESKKSYVRYISHELRTPLNTAFLGLKLLSGDLKASKSEKDAERYDTLVDVNMSCTAAVDILNDLLCYEKLESGILELHKENIAVSTFLRDSLLPFSVQARESGVIVTVETDRADVTPSHSGYFRSVPLQSHDVIFADKFKMDQVIRNLMSNALKFTPRGGHVTVKATFVHDNRPDQKTVSLRDRFGLGTRKGSRTSNLRSHRNPGAVYTDDTLSATPALTPGPIRGTLVIVMTDTGAGISKENQARLFNEIVQFSPEKLQAGGGSGLGLWITQEILNLHDGSISVSSEGEGMGSTFTIEMPMIRRPVTVSLPAEPKAPKIQSTETAQESNIGQGSMSAPQSTVGEVVDAPPGRQSYTVLIVDDSRLNRKMLLKCLRADGHTCCEAEDGLEAIAMVKERISHASGGCGRPYDAILMDFVMPNMDGPTATKEIRALGYTAPIFGVTGNGLPSDIHFFLSCGANLVLLKPLDIRAFGKAMKSVTTKKT